MAQEVCIWVFCFVPLADESVRIFGFAEYIAALALLVVVFTTVDVRYRFRIAIAPVPLRQLTYVLVGVIGLLALLPELWAAQHWWVFKTVALNQVIWQCFSGLLFLSLLLTWMHYAFVRPPIYGVRNAERFAYALYDLVLKGSDRELSVIADELRRSARPLVRFAIQATGPSKATGVRGEEKKPRKVSASAGYAHDILYMMGNRRLCRNMVLAAPNTVQNFFTVMAESGAYQLRVGGFSRNVTAEAIANKGSILYEEVDEFSSTLIGQLKPFSRAVFGDCKLMDGLGFDSPLNVNFQETLRWDAEQWGAYCTAVSVFLNSRFDAKLGVRASSVVNTAFSNVEHAISDTYKLENVTTDYWTSDIYQRLRCVVDFVLAVVKAIDSHPVVLQDVALRSDRDGSVRMDLLDHTAELMLKIVTAAASVSHTSDGCWGIHHNAVWAEFFLHHNSSPAHKIVAHRFRRRMFNHFVDMKKWPNYLGAKLIGFTLSVTGLSDRRVPYARDSRALGYLARRWAQSEFLKTKAEFPDVADACLIGTISLDEGGRRLVKTFAKGIKREPDRQFLDLNGPAPKSVPRRVRKLRPAMLPISAKHARR